MSVRCAKIPPFVCFSELCGDCISFWTLENTLTRSCSKTKNHPYLWQGEPLLTSKGSNDKPAQEKLTFVLPETERNYR